MVHPFNAAYYSEKNRAELSSLAVSDLDTAEHLWGGPDNTRAFRNVLVGTPERRGETWQAWITMGDVEYSDDALFYVLHHTQRIGKKNIDRWAVYAALDVHEPNLFIHEDVLPEGVERARQATEACESDMAPIFVGCDESLAKDLRRILKGAVKGEPVLLEYKEGPGSKHRVWPVKKGSDAEEIRKLFAGQNLFLLDGHHRLAAAKENHRFGMSDGRLLACITSMAESDTLILPLHRTVRYERWTLPDQLSADLVRAGCEVSELASLKVGDIGEYVLRHKESGPFCVVLHSYADTPLLVKLPKVASQPESLACLSVACLDFGVLAPITDATSIPVPSVEIALEQLAQDQSQVAFFLPPASPREVRAIALAKLRMPRKSTRFVPKPSLGLIARPWTNSG